MLLLSVCRLGGEAEGVSTVLCQLIPPLHLTPSRSWRLELSPCLYNPPISTYQVKSGHHSATAGPGHYKLYTLSVSPLLSLSIHSWDLKYIHSHKVYGTCPIWKNSLAILQFCILWYIQLGVHKIHSLQSPSSRPAPVTSVRDVTESLPKTSIRRRRRGEQGQPADKLNPTSLYWTWILYWGGCRGRAGHG